MIHKRTKIIATLGPKTDDPAMLKRLIEIGIDVVRVNFSHGHAADHIKRIALTRQTAQSLGRKVAVLADLQGPKVRVSFFKDGSALLVSGASFCLDQSVDQPGDSTRVGVDYPNLMRDVTSGSVLVLDDGLIRLRVDQVHKDHVACVVEEGGLLKDRKGLNLFGGGLSLPVISAKDRADLKTALEANVDYVALSFVQSADDIIQLKRLINDDSVGVIAKIERAEALEKIDDIVQASDGIMVARGDLAIEIGDAEVPAVQKMLIKRARFFAKPVITATQMMESMIESAVPTRAEVSDVANAVLDGSDAVMLSAETAVGRHPDRVVEAVIRVCQAAEKHPSLQHAGSQLNRDCSRVDEAIAMASMYVSNHLDIKAVVALTESGAITLWMSRIRSCIPIFGLSRHERTLCRMALYREVYPIAFDVMAQDLDALEDAVVAVLRKKIDLKSGDWILMTRGDYIGVHGHSNRMKIIQVQ
jgi:pyruvate kinase